MRTLRLRLLALLVAACAAVAIGASVASAAATPSKDQQSAVKAVSAYASLVHRESHATAAIEKALTAYSKKISGSCAGVLKPITGLSKSELNSKKFIDAETDITIEVEGDVTVSEFPVADSWYGPYEKKLDQLAWEGDGHKIVAAYVRVNKLQSSLSQSYLCSDLRAWVKKPLASPAGTVKFLKQVKKLSMPAETQKATSSFHKLLSAHVTKRAESEFKKLQTTDKKTRKSDDKRLDKTIDSLFDKLGLATS